jgi:hypothetical protein
MAQTQNQTQTPKFRSEEISYVRSYIGPVANMETKEILHLDRVSSPWSKDIVLVLEKLAVGVPNVATLIISDDFITLKLDERRKVRINRDGAAMIKVPDCALIADEKFLLLCMGEDGYYTPIAKGETITWDGTEEYFAPADIRRLVKETLKRVLQLASWL